MNAVDSAHLGATPRRAVPAAQQRSDGFAIAGRIAIYATLITFALFFLAPLVVMLVTSLKPAEEIRSGTFLALPVAPTLEAWSKAWTSACVGVNCIGVAPFYLNTFLITVPATLLSTLIGAINGYALTQVEFRGSRFIYGLLMLGCFTPYQGVLIPVARTLGFLDLAGSLSGLVLIHTIYGVCFTTMFFRNYFLDVPKELTRAARVDGAGFFQIFFAIMLPMSLPIMVVTVIWQFTSIWNDFLFGVAFTTGENAPIMVALNNIVNSSTGEREYNVDMAAALLAALPTIVIYVLAGKYFIRGLMAGSVKG
jgi:glucose/mannose transport system permease protein